MADVAMTVSERSDMKLRANGEQKWTPQKIVRLYVYAFLYDRIRANPTEFGLHGNTADNRDVERIISTKTETLMHKYNVYQMIPGGFSVDTFKTELARGDYSTDAKKFFNGYLKKPMGEFISIQDANEILLKKYDDCHKKMLDIKVPTDLDNGLMTFDSKSKEPTPKAFTKDYYYLQKMRAAEETLKNKKKLLRRTNFRFGRNLLITAAVAAAGVGFLGLMLSGGGAIFAGAFGTTLFSTGLGAGITGAVGAIASFFVGKTALGKVIKYFYQRRKQKEDLRDFVNGLQKYAPDGKEFKGYKDIKREFENAYTLRAIMIDDVRLFMEGNKDKGIEGFYAERFKKIQDEQKTYQDEYNKLLEECKKKGTVPDENELLALRNKCLKTKYPTEEEMVRDYKAFVQKKYPKFCKKSNINVFGQQPWAEVAKNAIYDYEVSSENSIFRKVAGVLDPQVYTSNAVNNPSVGELRTDIENADNIHTLDGLKQLYKDFTDSKNVSKFEEGNSGRLYAQLLSELGDKVSKRIEKIAFEEPLTSKTADDIKDALKDPQLQKAIEDAGVGGMTSKLKNRQVFISVESANEKAGYKTLQNDIGVSVQDQFHFGADEIMHACQVLGEVDDSVVEDIAKAIAGLSERVKSKDIETKISGLSGCPKTAKYLEFMRKKKTDAIALTASDIDKEFDDKGIDRTDRDTKDIIARIHGLKEADCCAIAGNMSGSAKVKVSGELDAIKKAIMKLSDDKKKECALACLDKQVKAIEMARRNRALESACDNLEADDNTSEIMEKIAALKFGQFNTEESGVVEIYKSLNSCSNAEYFKMKLSEKIYELCITESNKTEYKKVDGSNMEPLINFFIIVKDCNYLTQGQKVEIMRHAEEQFAESLKKGLENIIKNLLDSEQNINAATDKAEKLLNNNYNSGGLTEYFESNTPESREIQNLLIKIRAICNDKDSFFAQEVKGVKTKLTKVPLEVILDIPTDKVDTLISDFKTIKRLESTLRNPSNIEATGIKYDLIEQLLAKLEEIKKENGGKPSKEKLAKLMILKQTIISLHKYTLTQLIAAKYGDTNDYQKIIGHNRTELFEIMEKAWKKDKSGKDGSGIVYQLDDAINACRSEKVVNDLYIRTSGTDDSTASIIDRPFNYESGSATRYITNAELHSM